MQSGETQMEMKALHRLGWSITAIAREYNLSRTTVYKELAGLDHLLLRPTRGAQTSAILSAH